MVRRRSLITGVALLVLVPLLASCGSKQELPPPPPTEEETPREVERDVREAIPEETEDAALPYEFGNIHFEFDMYRLTSEARRVLKQHAQVLVEQPSWTVKIEGHCDERGTVEYNLALGEKRAKTAKDFLVRYGVRESRITTVSYGKERPVDPRHSEDAWAKNRRDVFIVDRG
jgi:peptidoglycan-associated lipoprotein